MKSSVTNFNDKIFILLLYIRCIFNVVLTKVGLKLKELAGKKSRFIMVIELSGVQFGLKSDV